MLPRPFFGAQLLDYILGPRIGKGAFGEIWCAVHAPTGILWAIKTEHLDPHRKTLEFEYQILSRLQSSPYFPRLGIFGRNRNFSFLSIALLGPSLSFLMKKRPARKFSLSTAVRASYHMLKCIEALHSLGFVHRDIKPANILTREGTDYPLCLIDFGLSRVYLDMGTGEHLPSRNHVGFRGTRAYASINAHLARDLSRRDDLISWFYITFELLIEPLPWRGVTDKQVVLVLKEQFDVRPKMAPTVPEMIEVWDLIQALKFNQEPNYERIYHLLIQISARVGFRFDDPFDWADLLHDHRNQVAQAVEQINIGQWQRSPSRTTEELTQTLLSQGLTASPLSQVSDASPCCCC
jgi:serine/threonine protein kinase